MNRSVNPRTAATFLFDREMVVAPSTQGAAHDQRNPNPPKPASTFPYGDYAPDKLKEAADRAMDHYLKPDDSEPEPQPSTQLFTVSDNVDTEALLANLSETLASANAMLSDLAFDLEGSRRHMLLGVAQMIELGALLANKALDRVELRT